MWQADTVPGADKPAAGGGGVTDRAARVLLADAHPLLRAGLRALLAEAPDLHVVGEAGDGADAAELIRRLLPDVLVLDAALPRLTDLTALTRTPAGQQGVRVLALTGMASVPEAVALLRSGAAGYLAKDSPAGELLGAVRAVAAGGSALSPGLLRELLGALLPLVPQEAPGPPKVLDALTERERQVLVEVARGHSNTEIAALLEVSETTVKTHVGHLLTKLRLRDRVQAVVLAYESGLVRPAIRTNGKID